MTGGDGITDGLVVNNSQVDDNTPMPQTDDTTTSRLPKQNDNTPPAMQRLNNTSTNSNDTALPESNVNGNSGNLVNNPKPVEASMANTSILANSRSSESDKENIDPAEGNKPKGKKTVKLVIKNPLSLSSLTAANIDMPERPPLPPPKAPEHEKPGSSQKDAKKPKGRMRVPSEQCGRNLCGRRWLKQVNNAGTKDEFEAFWWGTLSPQQRQAYDDEAKGYPTKKAWADKAVAEGKMH
ncbi:hypothetical protein PAXINDRAFT_21420 [Paxillus involutus ATCC 200175]|uniref:Uncharacterized protein n=1 Tax=Paxillus involutus ATCC 200175 TaxID=664439 RepID=A0A0C9TAR9_PAXIN|nr:hypothetical protein PAXINDRAFT_21420 [Paxillus involutus ATCC 200175]